MTVLIDLAALGILVTTLFWMSRHTLPIRWSMKSWLFLLVLLWAGADAVTHLSRSFGWQWPFAEGEFGYELMLPLLFLFFIISLQSEQTARFFSDSENTYRLILDNADELVYQIDLRGRLLFANNTALKTSGYSWAEAQGMHFARFIHRGDVRPIDQMSREKVLARERVRSHVRMRTKDGSLRYLDTTIVPMVSRGKVVAFQGIARDVTNERRALNQAQFLASVITESEAPILIFDENGRITVWNRGVERLTTISRAEAIGRVFDELFPDAPDILLETAARGGVYTLEMHIPVKEEHVPLLLTAYRVMMPDKHAAHAVFLQDISRQRKLEEQLLHHQRMEALGKLAGGIAHDFNNILTIISGNSAILKNREDLPQDMRHYIDAIARTTKRGAALTSQLLTFSRRQPFVPKRLAVEELIEDTVDLLAHAGWEGIRFETAIEPNLPTIWADSGRLQQVLMNLCVNGRDAMGSKGTLSIKALRQEYLTESDIPPGTDGIPGVYVVLSVTDTGTGMDEETLDQIFEPFFTTKSPSKGTGLGLANVHGIVRQHRGWIDVETKLGRGSTFHVVLPSSDTYTRSETSRQDDHFIAADSDLVDQFLRQADHAVAEQGTPKEEEPGLRVAQQLRGSETVLFVDDETLVRDVGQAALELYGYKVVTASSGQEAVTYLAQNPDLIDIIVLDWSMREMDGKGVLEMLRDVGSTIPVLMQSGVWPTSQKKKLFDHGARGFLAKPYIPDTLVSEIRRILDSTRKADV